MSSNFTISLVILFAVCLSPLLANDKFVSIHDVTTSQGARIFADNHSLETRTVVLVFPILENMEVLGEFPVVKLLLPLAKNVLLAELKKKDLNAPHHYRYLDRSVKGDKVTGRVSWLGIADKTEDPDIVALKKFLSKPFPKYCKPDPKPFWDALKMEFLHLGPISGKAITNEMLNDYSVPINKTMVLKVRCEKIGRTVVILAQNGCPVPKKLTLKFSILKNLTVSKEIPYVVTVPAMTEQYLLFLRCENGKRYNYRYQSTYESIYKPMKPELELPASAAYTPPPKEE